MNTPSEMTTAGTKSSDPETIWKKRAEHLVHHQPTRTFYARLKIKGKTIRKSLGTDVFTTAKLRLPDALKMIRKPKAQAGTFADGRVQFEAETRNKHELAELSRVYRLRCVDRIVRSWPGLDNRRVDTITKAEMDKWAKEFSDLYAPQFFNNSLNVFREILSLAGLKRDDNPAWQVKRRGIPRKPLKLPTADQFNQLVNVIATSGAAQARDCADLVRFLAFSGCRISEAKQALWQDVDWKNNELTIHCLKRRATSDEVRSRAIPLVPAMRQFLIQLHRDRQPKPDDAICEVNECQGALTRACKIVGCARLTHHSLRHLFATFTIEAGIDIPSVSKWLGHSDGGALAMKVYGHLRREHSQLMAQRVTFGALPEPANVMQLTKEISA
ncbi:MAG TPA: site-specific integrase [Verrucomicrobiae bacterium]